MDRQLLSRATENSDAPTPGYMYLDIAKNAASNPAVCSDIAKYLTGRLASKNNANIKFKCLKIIAKTATSPYLRGQFKRCLSQDPQAMSAIKDALQFRGPPDPVRGDQPYERVRTTAKEAVDAIYSDTPADSSGGAPFSTSASASYGPSAHQQGGYGGQSYGGGGGGARRMEGIGNPMFKDPRLEPEQPQIGNMSINELAKEAKETVIGMIKDPLARNVDVNLNNRAGVMPRPGGYGGGYQGGSYNYPPGRNELVHSTNGEWTMKSNRGPGAVSVPPNYANDAAYYKSRENGNNAYAWAQNNAGAASGGVGGSWATSGSVASQAREPSYAAQHQATPSITVTGGAVTHTSGGGTAVSDGSYEKQLVMELCPPGGMKAEPPPDKLAQFARSVSNLNADLVCPVLLDCLEEGQPWIIRAKALWVMETCVKHGTKPGAASNVYADFFNACQGEFAPLANHNRAAVRDPAKRLLSSLGVATPVASSTARVAAPPAAAPPAPVTNLLDFDDETPVPAPAAPAPPPPPTPPAAGGDSLFGGLNVAGTPAPATAPPASPAPVPAPVPAATSGNLLGDDLMSSGPAPTTPAPAAGGQSLFGDMTVKSPAPAPQPAPPPEVAQTSSMFDNMSLKQEEPKKEEPMPSMPAGSAFGFISADAAEQKKENAPVPNSMDSFDPLKNMTPNSAKQMMQFSPEQMQAMAYQQMMMQQQMQMQMMAMQQQQRGSGKGMFMPMAGGHLVMQNPAAAKTAFAFMDKPKKEESHSFDFVQDAMKRENKK